jgi:hypothetical protein
LQLRATARLVARFVQNRALAECHLVAADDGRFGTLLAHRACLGQCEALRALLRALGQRGRLIHERDDDLEGHTQAL